MLGRNHIEKVRRKFLLILGTHLLINQIECPSGELSGSRSADPIGGPGRTRFNNIQTKQQNKINRTNFIDKHEQERMYVVSAAFNNRHTTMAPINGSLNNIYIFPQFSPNRLLKLCVSMCVCLCVCSVNVIQNTQARTQQHEQIARENSPNHSADNDRFVCQAKYHEHG